MQKKRWLLSAGLLAAATASTVRAGVGVFTVNTLYSFGATGDGQSPAGAPIVSGSNLYGLTTSGGSSTFGTVYQYNIPTNAESVAYSFKGGSELNDNFGVGSLYQSGNVLYGATSRGGTYGFGTDFSLTLGANSPVILHAFGAASPMQDGDTPIAPLIASGSLLYGVTTTSTATNSEGIIYSVNPSTSAEAILHYFPVIGSTKTTPTGALVQAGSLMYGLANLAGVSQSGILYSFNSANNAMTTLHTFNTDGTGTDGFTPVGSLIQSGTLLYGATSSGGPSGYGTIFKYDTTTGNEQVLYSFPGGTNAVNPIGSLVQSGPYLYGLTADDGTFNGESIFAYNTQTNTESTLAAFPFSAGAGGVGVPVGSLTLSGSTLYGVTSNGGTYNKGTLFSVPALPVPEPTSAASLAISALMVSSLRRRRLAARASGTS